MNWLIRFLLGAGVRTFHVIRLLRSLITDADIAFTVDLVKHAQTKFLENKPRRDWVVSQLTRREIPESIARLLVEIAVRLVKKEGDRLVDKAALAIKV